MIVSMIKKEHFIYIIPFKKRYKCVTEEEKE